MKTNFTVRILVMFALGFAGRGTAPAANAVPAAAIDMGARGGVPNFVAKLEAGEDAHVAFLGGSITQKAGGHAAMVGDWLKEKWPEVDFTFTNAGLSSTCSVTGAFRLERDVLSKGPVDLLVVEFAVNDDQDAAHDRRIAIRGLEGVIRHFFRRNPTGEAISVQFVNPDILEATRGEEKTVSVAAHEAVAEHYGIPAVNVARALAAEIEAGRMTWDEDYGGTHPNPSGYRFATEQIVQVIGQTEPAEIEPVTLPEPLDANSYFGAEILDPQSFDWLGGWRYEPVSEELLPVGTIRPDYRGRPALRSDEAGNYLYRTFSGAMLCAFVLAGPDAGMLEVSVDEGDWERVDLYHRHSERLNYPRTVILADDLSPGSHRVAIRVADEKAPESGNHAATILYFGANVP